MSWERFSEIHIDHIIPRSHFEYESEEDEQFKQCWALSNLQPRWATTRIAEKYGSEQVGNLNKGARFIG
jgi:hypothetical protein